MFPTWRLQLREARLAWRRGRVDEAGTLLSAAPLCDFLPAKELARDVAGSIVERARQRLAGGDTSAGWHDLATADRLGAAGEATGQLRQQYVEHVLAEVVGYLAADQPTAAVARLDKLDRRGVSNEAVRRMRQIAQAVVESDQLAARGHFAEAAAASTRADDLVLQHPAQISTMKQLHERLAERTQRLERDGGEIQRLSAEMHGALAKQDWSGVLAAADALLAVAPQHLAAGQARRRAWQAVGMEVTLPHQGRRAARPVSIDVRQAVLGVPKSTHAAAAASEDDTVTGKNQPQRGLLWIDAVGGFLVCLDDAVALGQPAAGDTVAVPILADLSRRHATIRREGGAYVLSPVHSVSVDGQKVDGPYVLADNQLIQLGDSVRLRFTKPHALSATARLVIESHHKTQPSADAVLLMADSIVLGPQRHAHIRCRDWEHDVVVYRQNNSLYCRAERPLVLDGEACQGASELAPGARVEGEGLAFTWEAM